MISVNPFVRTSPAMWGRATTTRQPAFYCKNAGCFYACLVLALMVLQLNHNLGGLIVYG